MRFGVPMKYFSIAAMFCAFALSPVAAQKSDIADLRKLIDEIAKGDTDDARDAADSLIDRVLGPLTDAIGSLEKRPVEEQVRLERAISRIMARLRIRLARIDLPDAEKQLLDKLLKDEPELAEQLFDDDADARIEAVKRVPLEPNGVAGIVLALKVSDPDERVADAAIEQAERFRDPVLLRGLRHFLIEATRVAQSGVYGGAQGYLINAYEARVRPCIKIFGAAKYKEAVPEILAALPVFWRRELMNVYQLPDIFDALARIGDEQAVKPLLKMVNETDVYSSRHAPGNRTAQLTVGDTALLAAIRIFGLNPVDFGFYVESDGTSVFGFIDSADRDAALRAFALWHRDNADKPAAERKPPVPLRASATQPAGK